MNALRRLRPLARGRARAARAAIALAFALAAPPLPAAPAAATPAAGAATFAEYAARVADARSLALRLDPEGRLGEDPAQVAGRIDALLPDGETVVVGDARVRVDQSVLSGLLERVKAARTPEDRRDAVELLREHLHSLALAAPTARTAGPAIRSDPASLRTLLDARKPSSGVSITEELRKLVERITTWLKDRLGAALTPKQASWLNTMVWVVVIAGLSLLLIVIAVRAYVSLRRAVADSEQARSEAADLGKPVVAAAEGLPADALAYAEDLAAAGEYRAAVRALFGGAARSLVHAGVLAQTRTRTDDELLAEVAPASPAAHLPLAELTRGFERAWYGHADPGADGFARARELYGSVLKAVAA